MDTFGRRLGWLAAPLLSLAIVGAAAGARRPAHAVEAAFAQRSYAPGATAILHLRGTANRLRIRLYHAGAGHEGVLQGSPVGPQTTLGDPAGSVAVQLGAWPSGLYYARIGTPGRGVRYAPFTLRPRHLGAHRVLVVLPTNTWQAYNFEDGDSWYADEHVHTIDLSRPFADGGGATSAGPKRPSWVRSTSTGTTIATRTAPSSSPAPNRRRGSSAAPGCATATASASMGSRSTRAPTAHRPRRACSPGSRESS